MAETGKNISRIHLLRSSAEVIFGDVTYLPGGDCGPRTQEDYQLVLLYSGHADIFLDDADVPLHIAPGHVALMRPGRREYFRFTPGTATHHGWCALAPSLVDTELAREIASRPQVIPYSAQLAALVRLGLAVGSPRSEAADRLVTQLGKTVLLEFLATAEGLAPVLPAALQRACAFIEGRYTDKSDLADLARAGCVTPAHLIRLFNQHLGMTPMRYLWRARTEAATRLLRETGLSVGEIAERTGFQTPFHLSRLVKKSCGLSPRELRRRVWNTPPGGPADD